MKEELNLNPKLEPIDDPLSDLPSGQPARASTVKRHHRSEKVICCPTAVPG